MLSVYDYLVIGFYFCFMLGVGWFFRRFSRNSSDYFRGGGQMTWWLVGASAFMGSFSAWTFTGAASTAYDAGLVIMVIYLGNALGFLLNFTHFAPWFRQIRTITVMEAVRQRYGRVNEQFFTWLQMPIQVLYAGIWLFGLGVFVASVFQVNIQATIIVTGLVVLFMATIGGSWAVIAGDFLQAMVLLPITVIVAFLALRETGGVSGLIGSLPESHLDITGSSFAEYGLAWAIAMMVSKIFVLNNMQDAARYLCVKDGRAARKAALLSAILFLVGPIIWFIPPMAARVLYPDLHSILPGLSNPSEGAYVAIAIKTLPVGLMGLLITGIFSATMSSMDTGLNRNAGIFIRNVYLPFLRPRASEHELVFAGRFTSVVMGLLVIGIALVYSSWKDMGLFKLMVNFGALVGIPYSIPLLWCIIIRRVPPWSGWSTVLVCLLGSLLVSNGPNWAWCQSLMHSAGWDGLLAWVKTHDFLSAMIVNIGMGSTWFLGTSFFYKYSSTEYKQQAAEFFATMGRPVDFEVEIGEHTENRQAGALSTLCFVYGGFITILLLIPNSLLGRGCIAFCAASLLIVGGLLRMSQRAPAGEALHVPVPPDDKTPGSA